MKITDKMIQKIMKDLDKPLGHCWKCGKKLNIKTIHICYSCWQNKGDNNAKGN